MCETPLHLTPNSNGGKVKLRPVLLLLVAEVTLGAFGRNGVC